MINYRSALGWYGLILFVIIVVGFYRWVRGKSSQKCDGLMENDDASRWRAFGSGSSAQEISGESISARVRSLCSGYDPDASIAAALSGVIAKYSDVIFLWDPVSVLYRSEQGEYVSVPEDSPCLAVGETFLLELSPIRTGYDGLQYSEIEDSGALNRPIRHRLVVSHASAPFFDQEDWNRYQFVVLVPATDSREASYPPIHSMTDISSYPNEH